VEPRDLALVLTSALLHATWNAAAKGSARPTAFLLAMEAATLPLAVAVLAFGFSPAEVPTPVWGLLVATGIVHALYATCLGRAYAAADLSVVYPIARSTPALLPLAAWPLLGERPEAAGLAGIAMVVAGMWAVQTDGRLRREALVGRGAVFAYLTLLATVGYSLLDKEAMRRLHEAAWSGPAPRPLAFLALLYAFYLPFFLWTSRRDARPSEVLAVVRARPVAVLAAGAVAIASYALTLEALRRAPVSYVVAVRQSSILFGVAIGAVWLRERPGRVRVAGAAAIVAGVAAIALAR